MKTSIRFFLYARKSTDEKDRQVMSLDSQTNELRALAKREHLFIYETIEESKTSKQPGRPLFNKLLDRIEHGEANGLLCWDIDRLYRNPIDEGRVRWLLQKGVIASIRTPSRQFLPDDAGLLMGVEGGRATDYIIRLAKNVKRGIQEKLRRGEWPGGSKPLGYIYDDRLRNIVADPQRAPIVQTVFSEYAEGRHGLLSVSQRLYGLGVTSRTGRPWSKFAVWQFLTNRVYIGLIKWDGEIYEGKYKTFISPELFKRVQDVLKNKSKPRKVRQGHHFPFCGLFRCSCGAMMTAQWTKGHGGLYRYYRCTRKNGPCSERYVQEESVRQQCLTALRPLSLTAEQATAIRIVIDEEATKDSQSLGVEVKILEDKLIPLQQKLDRLTHAYLDEVIDEETYRRTKDELLVQKNEAKKEKERLVRTRASFWIEPAQEVISTLETLGKTGFAESLSDISKTVQKIGTNRLISRKTVTFSLSEPYAFALSLLGSLHVEPSNSTPSRSDTNLQSSLWCSLVSHLRTFFQGQSSS